MKKQYDRQKLKSFPKLKTDKAAENFVRDADLTAYDFSGFKPMKFEFANKSSRVINQDNDPDSTRRSDP